MESAESLKNIDLQLQKIIVLLNRIPHCRTLPCCAGHVYPDEKLIIMAADSYLNFITDEGTNQKLIEEISKFASQFSFCKFQPFVLPGGGESGKPEFWLHRITIFFDDWGSREHFKQLPQERQENYLDKFDERKREIDLMWQELTRVLKNTAMVQGAKIN